MRSHEERVAETKRRIAKMEREKRLRRNTITMASAVAACLVLLVGVSLAMPGIAANIQTGNYSGFETAASMYGGGADMFPVSETLVLNANNQLVKFVLNHKDGENTGKICQQLYDLAKLAHGSLSPERMTKFIARSGEIMMDMAREEQ